MKTTPVGSFRRCIAGALFIAIALFTGPVLSGETSTQHPVNKGAARQIYGSGSLRQTGSSASVAATTSHPPPQQQKPRGEQEPKNSLKNEEKSPDRSRAQERPVDENSYETYEGGYGGYGSYVQGGRGHQRTHTKFPAGLYENGKLPPSVPLLDYDVPEDDLPSYRNGAPVNGMRGSANNAGGYYGIPGQGRSRVGHGFDRAKGRGGYYDGAGYEGYGGGYSAIDRSRVKNGLWRGHGIGQTGEVSGRFGPDQKTLIQELEDEGEPKNLYSYNPCGSICANDQFLCINSCTCISMDGRCDGLVDCQNAEDESDCEKIFEAWRFNSSCHGERNIPCPETGFCIAKEWLCDGDDDCGDYSDESHCGSHLTCTDDQFECRNGLCVPNTWLCDGENDCKDFSDEMNCSSAIKCTKDEYTCPDGSCIPKNWQCDGEVDCTDGSDESKCELPDVHCGENEFECAYPRCILKSYKCDGDDDCGDWSDEENCPTTVGSSCNANEFRCASGKCISEKWVCDKEDDCRGGEDEENCKYPTPKACSSQNEYTCTSGMCIPKQWVCDGVPDCPDGEEESGCSLTCEATQYLCKPPPTVNETTSTFRVDRLPSYHHHPPQHRCIALKHVCDGVPDCPLQDDEVNCPKKRRCTAQDQCTQQCILTTDNRKTCACRPGFTLAADNFTCNDINECEFEKEPVCSQLCNNTIGSFVCGCMTGYVLRPDLRTCKALGANPTLLFANRVDIRQVSLSGSKYTSIIKGLQNAIALDYHYKRGLIYWSDVSMHKIRKVFINGSDVEDVIRWGLESPGGVAIDWVHNLLFWTDSGTRRVEVITLDSKVRHVLISSDLDKPRAIAVHPHYGYVYWTDWGPNPKIERADMDGSDRSSLITESIFWPNGLTIDYTTDRIYWTDAKYHVMETSHLDGSDRKKVISRGLHHPFAITIFEDLVYWTDWHFKSISSANKGNGHGFKTIHAGFYFPMDIHSYHPQRQPDYPNHCGKNNGKCSHMCLPNSTGYSCVCPVGLKIKRDGKNCASNPDELLIFARKKDLRLIPIDQSLNRVFDTVIPVDHIHSAVALTWDADNNTIFWTDVEADTISTARLNGSNQSVVIKDNLELPAGLAIDWITKKLYWTDAGTNRLECANVDGTMRTLLIYKDLVKPRDIVVDPTMGYMYWSDWGKKPKIEKAAMDGSQRKILIKSNLSWPNGLAIDFDKKRLYWADGGTKKIEYSDLDGNGRTVLIPSGLLHPFGLVIHKNNIFWTDWTTLSIHRADKDTGAHRSVIRPAISGLMDVRVFHRNRQSVPDNPCSRNNGNCSHICLLAPAPRRYSCACPIGLVINPDGKTCPDMPRNFLVVAHRKDIRLVSLDTDYKVNTIFPVQGMTNTSGVDVDKRTGDIYWTDPGNDVIKSATFNGKNPKDIVNNRLDTADSLVVDSIGRKLYWTDAGLNSIEVCELDGRNRKVLIWSGLDNPRAIALHYSAGLMFWSDWGQNARIERTNMDGEERMTVIADNLMWPNGISIDYAENKLYWNDAKRNVIERSDLQGQNREVLVNNVKHPYGLAVMGDYIYWTDWNEKAILQANKTTGANQTVLVDKLEGLMDVAAVDRSTSYEDENVCGNNNGGCSHLCLRNPRGFSCACPTGILLEDDGKTCATTPKNFLLFATKEHLARISFDTPEMWEVVLPIKDVHKAISVDYHWEKGLIFFTDVHLETIRAVNMHNYSDVRTIVQRDSTNGSSPFRIAVDWIADNIYWIDMKHKVIEVARIDGSHRKKLLTDLDEAISIVVFPKQGYMFWTEWGGQPKIVRATLDGKNKRTVVSTDLAYPNGLSIDHIHKNLYWADALKSKIEKSDLNGQYRVQLVLEANNPFGLTLYGGHIYWADWMKQIIERVDMFTGKNQIKIHAAVCELTELKAISPERQTGWTPCAINNGGCSHLCLFARRNYSCACPDKNDGSPCSTVPKEKIAHRKPGAPNLADYDELLKDDEPKIPEVVTRSNTRSGSHNNVDGKFNDYKFSREKGYSLKTVIITIVIMVTITLAIVVIIIYLLCQRKTKQKKYVYASRRNVLTFSNPNYNASSGESAACNPPQDKKSFIWKRLKYDRSQERVYEDNGQTSSPEVLSLIPPSATPSSSRAASVTPRESSPPAPMTHHLTHLNG